MKAEPDIASQIQQRLEGMGSAVAGFIETLKSQSKSFWLAGGIVRDSAFNREVNDVDIAADFDPVALARDYANSRGLGFVVLDEERRVARIVISEPRRIDIDIAKLTGETIEEDLANRDFTINAIALKPYGDGWAVIDPFDGIGDINQKALRPVSAASIKADPVRGVRAFRFSSTYGLSILPDVVQQIKQSLPLISAIPGERILAELLHILNCDGGVSAFKEMAQCGLLFALFPELDGTVGVTQNDWHHLDVFEHSIETVYALEEEFCHDFPEWLNPWKDMVTASLNKEVSFGVTRLAVVKLAAILHDCGKPACRAVAEDGKVTFYGHEKTGETMAESAAKRLRLPNSAIDGLKTLVKNHLRPFNAIADETITKRAMYRYHRDLGEWAIAGIVLALADARATKGPAVTEQRRETERLATRELMAYIESETIAKTTQREPLLTGNDLMRELGLKPGPIIGKALELLREAENVGEISSKEEALELVKQMLMDIR